jgi:hypothetical protein
MHTVVVLIAVPVLAALAALQMSSKAENNTRDFVTIAIIAMLMTLASS